MATASTWPFLTATDRVRLTTARTSANWAPRSAATFSARSTTSFTISSACSATLGRALRPIGRATATMPHTHRCRHCEDANGNAGIAAPGDCVRPARRATLRGDGTAAVNVAGMQPDRPLGKREKVQCGPPRRQSHLPPLVSRQPVRKTLAAPILTTTPTRLSAVRSRGYARQPLPMMSPWSGQFGSCHQALAAQRAEAAAAGQHLAPEDAWLTLLSAIAVHEHRHVREVVASG